MKIALFGAPVECLQALLRESHDVTLIRPPVRIRSRLGRLLRSRPEVEEVAEAAKVRWVRYSSHDDVLGRLLHFRPDVVCIATFPFKIPTDVLEAARLPAINLHTSLLPRYRGPNPFFWVYHNGDLDTGWTVHLATDRFDAGPILVQESVPVPRGYPVTQLGREMRASSGSILLKGIEALLAGRRATRQTEADASRAPNVDFNTLQLPFRDWHASQAWHFLAGYRGLFRPSLTDTSGRAFKYNEICGFDEESSGAPGTVVRTGDGWRLNCASGAVHLRRSRGRNPFHR